MRAKASTLAALRGLTSLRAGLGLLVAVFALLAFGPAAALAQNPPALSVTGSSEVGVTAAQLEGTVNPEGEAGSPATYWHFEVSADNGSGEPDGNWIYSGGAEISGAEAEEAKAIAVTGLAESLQPATTYFIKLVADNAEFANHVETGAPYSSFETGEATAPALAVKKTTAIGYTGATLNGTIDPNGGNVNPIDGPLAIYWQLEAREVGVFPKSDEGWNVLGGELAGADAESTTPVPISGELPPGTLGSGKTYEVRAFAYYLNFSGQTYSPPIPLETFTTNAATAPLVTIDDASALTATSAHFSGHVTPTNGEADPAFDAFCTFDYLTDAKFKAAGDAFPEGSPTIGCDVNPVTGSGPTAVQADPTDLEPHTTYHLRLRASNQAGTTTAEAATFTTDSLPPAIISTFVDGVSDTGAVLNATLNPRGAATTYHFQYVTQAQFDDPTEGGFAQATATPESASIGDDNTPHPASEPIPALEPDASYRFRVIATNAEGTVEGPDRGFHTLALPDEEPQSCPNADAPGVGKLPECRAYELVSPPDKNGGDVHIDTARVRIADDGAAAAFPSLKAFADPLGTGTAVDYVSVRSSDPDPGDSGWATHAVTPPQSPLSLNAALGADPLYVGDYSADLSKAVFRAWTPLTDDPDVAATTNLYLRETMLDPGGAGYRLITLCPLCDSTGPLPELATPFLLPAFAGASVDFQHIAFDGRIPLTADAPSTFQNGVYAWDDGQLHYAGYIPSGSDISCGGADPACVPATNTIAGASATDSRPINVISRDGTRIFFKDTTTGRLYVRIANTRTEEITASERAAPDLFQSATFLAASPDGNRALFSTKAALTEDAPLTGPGDTKLYIYDATKPPSDPGNLTYVNMDAEPAGGTDIANNVVGTMAANDDLSYVYFIATGQLVPGEPLLGTLRGFYMWHDGHIAYIGEMRQDETIDDSMIGNNLIVSVQSRVTPDGRHFLFSTKTGSGLPLEYDQGSCSNNVTKPGCRELYVYSADTETLACASCNPTGEPATSHASTGFRVPSSPAHTYHFNRAISDDGGHVFFSTGDALLPEDTNGRQDAYQYDVQTQELHLISSGTDPSDSYFLEASPDGRDVLFATRQRLSRWDVDTSIDVYDARVNGGFPEPPPVTAPCSGDSCKPPPPLPPGTPPTTSAGFSGPGNVNTKRCPRGRRAVRSHGRTRCVRSRHHKRKKAAADSRRAK